MWHYEGMGYLCMGPDEKKEFLFSIFILLNSFSRVYTGDCFRATQCNFVASKLHEVSCDIVAIKSPEFRREFARV